MSQWVRMFCNIRFVVTAFIVISSGLTLGIVSEVASTVIRLRFNI